MRCWGPPSLVEIAELLGVTKQQAHELADEPGFPAPVADDGRSRLWDRPKVERWAKRWWAENGAEPLSAVEHRPSRGQRRGFAAGFRVARLPPVTFITFQTGSRASVQPLWKA